MPTPRHRGAAASTSTFTTKVDFDSHRFPSHHREEGRGEAVDAPPPSLFDGARFAAAEAEERKNDEVIVVLPSIAEKRRNRKHYGMNIFFVHIPNLGAVGASFLRRKANK